MVTPGIGPVKKSSRSGTRSLGSLKPTTFIFASNPKTAFTSIGVSGMPVWSGAAEDALVCMFIERIRR